MQLVIFARNFKVKLIFCYPKWREIQKITYDFGRLVAGIEKGLMPNDANWAAGIAFIIEESVVDAKRVAITVALFEAAT